MNFILNRELPNPNLNPLIVNANSQIPKSLNSKPKLELS